MLNILRFYEEHEDGLSPLLFARWNEETENIRFGTPIYDSTSAADILLHGAKPGFFIHITKYFFFYYLSQQTAKY